MPLFNHTSQGDNPDSNLYHRILNLANHDLCPWANRYVYWLKQPIGWLIVAATACILIGLAIAPQGWVMFAAIVAVIIVGVTWPWIAIHGISCNLRFKRRRATEGDKVQVILSIRNSFPWPIWGLAVEGGFFSEDLSNDADPTAVALERVPGWSTSEYVWEYKPHRRGVYPATESQVTNAFPFGIWTARDLICIESTTTVWPRTVKLASVPPVPGTNLAATGCLMDSAGHAGDVLAVRPYRRGDSLKHVHWAQTARHGQFIVCERQAATQRNVNVAIDTDPQIHFSIGQENSLEWTVRIAASLIREFHEHGWIVTCSPSADGLHQGQRSTIESIFDHLAVLQPSNADTPNGLNDSVDTRHQLRIVITTALRMEQLSEPHNAPVSTRFVVLSHEPTVQACSSWMDIDCRQDIPNQLDKQWERLCHDTWSTN